MTRRLLNAWGGAAALAAALIAHPSAADAALAKSVVLEKNVAYLRVAETGTTLANDISSALDGLEATNPIAGVVLDLRFAKGTTDAGVAPAERLLEEKKLPLAILINTQTAAPAARLAEDLREANTGLVFGASPDNFQPDIRISVSTNEEIAFLKSPYAILNESNMDSEADTNLLPYVDIDHTTEADLVREKIKDGEEVPVSGPGPEEAAPPSKPFIRDPVLAHGVDFIKGLAVLHLSRK